MGVPRIIVRGTPFFYLIEIRANFLVFFVRQKASGKAFVDTLTFITINYILIIRLSLDIILII